MVKARGRKGEGEKLERPVIRASVVLPYVTQSYAAEAAGTTRTGIWNAIDRGTLEFAELHDRTRVVVLSSLLAYCERRKARGKAGGNGHADKPKPKRRRSPGPLPS